MDDHTRCRPAYSLGWTALLVFSLLNLAGCGVPVATADAPGSDVGQRVGVVELHKLLLVSAGEGRAGRISGTLVNDSTAPVEVMISDTDDEVIVVVPAHSSYRFTSQAAIFDTVSAASGRTATISVATPAVSVSIDIPVVDGTADLYKSFLPDRP